jgi:hypothetical protein
VTVRAEFTALKKLAARSRVGQADDEVRCREFHDAADAWEDAYATGGPQAAGALPDLPRGWWMTPQAFAAQCRVHANVKARLRGLIGPADFLAGMAEGEREEVEAFWVALRTAAVVLGEVFP